jgi:hypothetical protein
MIVVICGVLPQADNNGGLGIESRFSSADGEVGYHFFLTRRREWLPLIGQQPVVLCALARQVAPKLEPFVEQAAR